MQVTQTGTSNFFSGGNERVDIQFQPGSVLNPRISELNPYSEKDGGNYKQYFQSTLIKNDSD